MGRLSAKHHIAFHPDSATKPFQVALESNTNFSMAHAELNIGLQISQFAAAIITSPLKLISQNSLALLQTCDCVGQLNFPAAARP